MRSSSIKKPMPDPGKPGASYASVLQSSRGGLFDRRSGKQATAADGEVSREKGSSMEQNRDNSKEVGELRRQGRAGVEIRSSRGPRGLRTRATDVDKKSDGESSNFDQENEGPFENVTHFARVGKNVARQVFGVDGRDEQASIEGVLPTETFARAVAEVDRSPKSREATVRGLQVVDQPEKELEFEAPGEPETNGAKRTTRHNADAEKRELKGDSFYSSNEPMELSEDFEMERD